MGYVIKCINFKTKQKTLKHFRKNLNWEFKRLKLSKERVGRRITHYKIKCTIK